MPDPHVPDRIVEELRRENSRLLRELSELTARYNVLLDSSTQSNLALARVASENFALRKRLGEG